ncbi:MAG: rhomboid family intramembrane serine protease [Desulfobacterales bacterium]
MHLLYQNLTEEQADTFGLVLAASGIFYHTDRKGSGWRIQVRKADAENALSIMRKHLAESQSGEPEEDAESLPRKTYAGVWISILLIAAYVAEALLDGPPHASRSFGSSASRIMDGQYYRTITSLFLHANAGHLAGNIIGMALFGTAACRTAGWGAGFLIILLSGGIGNLMNAFLYKAGHVSIGASTSVFGSIGFLSGFSFLDKSRQPGGRRRAWLSIGGGLALLAFLGSGEQTDVMAHLCGFSAGILFAAPYSIWGGFLKRKAVQVMCMVFTVAIIGVSWLQGVF